MSIGESIIYFWCAISIFIEIISSVVLKRWLHRHGAKTIFLFTGTPGYLEYVYYDWCRNHGESSTRVIILRSILFINVVVACVIFVLLQMSKNN
jgi:hypothetical protein